MRILLALTLLFQGFIYSNDASFKEVALYYSPRCPYSQKVLSYIRKNDLEVTLKDITVDAKAKDELIKYGGHKIVPCLLVDHVPIYNANDIIDWLSKHQVSLSKTEA
jgi:glutaredoxin 3